jgi:hypothetical protein
MTAHDLKAEGAREIVEGIVAGDELAARRRYLVDYRPTSRLVWSSFDWPAPRL